jgi:hypothetical protein
LVVTLSDFHWNMHITFLNMPNNWEPHPCWTMESMNLSILANIGTLNLLNGSIPKDSSNPKLNHPVLSTTTNTTNGCAYSFLSTTCI